MKRFVMRPSDSRSITRVVVDGDYEIELAQLHSVMQRIQRSLQSIPEAEQTYVSNALLNLAVCRMLREAGDQRTATVLIRLADVVLETNAPPPSHAAIDLTA